MTPNNFLDDILSDVHYTPPAPGEETEIECDVAPKELPVGHVLHGYRILKVLGAGGFGITYLAEEKTLERRVVLKENFPDALCHRQSKTLDVVQTSPELNGETFTWAHNNFLREARLLSSLNHPNIAKVYSFFHAHSTSYYVTEFIAGKSLADTVREYSKADLTLSQDALLGVLFRVLDALDYIHSREVLHRDIKPDNILINTAGLPMLIDFGAAREEYGDTGDGVVESVGFSPKEQSVADGKMGPWTDLYALGATFYYLLTGECLPESRQRDLYDMAEKLEEIPRLSETYSPILLRSIQKAINPAIEDRYASAAEWIHALRPIS